MNILTVVNHKGQPVYIVADKVKSFQRDDQGVVIAFSDGTTHKFCTTLVEFMCELAQPRDAATVYADNV